MLRQSLIKFIRRPVEATLYLAPTWVDCYEALSRVEGDASGYPLAECVKRSLAGRAPSAPKRTDPGVGFG